MLLWRWCSSFGCSYPRIRFPILFLSQWNIRVFCTKIIKLALSYSIFMSYFFCGNYQFYFSEYTRQTLLWWVSNMSVTSRRHVHVHLSTYIMFVLSGMHSANVGRGVKINSRTINRKFIATQLRTAVFSTAPRIVRLKNRSLEKETRFIQPASKCGIWIDKEREKYFRDFLLTQMNLQLGRQRSTCGFRRTETLIDQ